MVLLGAPFLFACASADPNGVELHASNRHLAYVIIIFAFCGLSIFSTFVLVRVPWRPPPEKPDSETNEAKYLKTEEPPEKRDSRTNEAKHSNLEEYKKGRPPGDKRGLEDLIEYKEYMKQETAKNIDMFWICLRDQNLERRFVRLTYGDAYAKLLPPLACVLAFMTLEVCFDRDWAWKPAIFNWKDDAAIIFNVGSLTIFGCIAVMFVYMYKGQTESRGRILRPDSSDRIETAEEVLVGSVVWIMSLILLFGTRARAYDLLASWEREVLGSTHSLSSENDEISVIASLTMALLFFSIYVPIRYYYLLHLGTVLAPLYPISFCLRGVQVTMSLIVAFYFIVAIVFILHRYIEIQRRLSFLALVRSLDERADLVFEDEMENKVTGTVLDRVMSDLGSVERIVKHLESRSSEQVAGKIEDMLGIKVDLFTKTRKKLRQSKSRLAHSEGLFALNVDENLRNSGLIDKMGFRRYLDTWHGLSSGGRKMFDGTISEQTAHDVLLSWNKRSDLRGSQSMRRETNASSERRHSIRFLPEACDVSDDMPETSEDVGPESQFTTLNYDLSGVGKDWNFNTFELAAKTGNRSMLFVAEATVVPLTEEVFTCIESKELIRLFVRRIWTHYHPRNQYHNETHGATVCHMAAWLTDKSGLGMICSTPERMAILVAALGHDCGHFARNNLFCQNSGHSLSYMYNDSSVLENMHAAITVRFLGTGDTYYISLLDALSLKERQTFKATVISMILGTDMKKHFETLSKFRSKLAEEDWSLFQPACRTSTATIILKGADLGQSAVVWEQHMEWSMRVLAEFFEQGDEELELHLPVSPLCDRATYNLCESQKFFADVLCIPIFQNLQRVAGPEESSPEALQVLLNQMSHNVERWKSWNEEFKFDPIRHNWPPEKWWPEWKHHTPTGHALVAMPDEHKPVAMPYPYPKKLEQMITVEPLLDAIVRYEPLSQGRGSDSCRDPSSSKSQIQSSLKRTTNASSAPRGSDEGLRGRESLSSVGMRRDSDCSSVGMPLHELIESMPFGVPLARLTNPDGPTPGGEGN